MKTSKFALIAIMLAGAAATPAEAQTEPSTANDSAQDDLPAESGLGDIIVTAQKRSENLQKTSAAVIAVSGEELKTRGISNILQLSNVLPSVRFNAENTNTKLFIRGIGSDFGVPWVSESVSTYVNGGLVQRFGNVSSFFDVESVQVLPGPQGVLYGRNSVGGTIQVTTKRPSQEAGGELTAELGNYGLLHGAAAVNVPLDGTLAIRAAVNFQKHGGYQTNGADTEGSFAGRLSALWKPSDDFSAFVWGQYWENNFHNASWQNLPFPDPSNPWFVPNPKIGFLPGYQSKQALSHATTKALGADFSLTLGSLTLHYIPFWMEFTSDEHRPVNGFDLPVVMNLSHQMHELRLSNDANERFSWLVGVNYFNSKGNFFYTFGPNLAGYDGKVNQESISGYVQGTFKATNALRLIAGGRYSSDQLSVPHADLIGTSDFVNFTPTRTPFTFNKRWNRFDWKVGAEFDVAERSMLYANVQTGHNQGTYNTVLNTATFSNIVKPQKLLGFTVGSKNRFFDNRLEFNLEAYYYRYDDFLLSTFSAATGVSVNFNAPRATAKGIQADIRLQATDNDTFSVSAGLLDAKIERFVDDLGRNFKDSRLPNSPTYTVNLGYQHRFDLSSGASVVARADSLISDGYWSVYTQDPFTRQGAYTKTDVSLTYNAPDNRWNIGVWGRNLEKQATLAAAGVGGIPGPASSYIDAPRTYGVKFEAKF